MEDADGYKESNGLDVYKDGELLTDFCIQFIEAMDKEGYTTGVYANYNYYKNVLNLERLANTRGFNMWLAQLGIRRTWYGLYDVAVWSILNRWARI